jgi:Family of unknown function (DUF695)
MNWKNVKVWATAISTHSGNGRKIIFRFAKDFSPTFEFASQPDRVILVWKYESETGQPVTEEHRQMDLLENTLELIVEEGAFATLALVSTGENLREWIYYARNGDEFIEKLNLALREMPVFPIEIHETYDPTWANYMQFRNGLRYPTN